MGSNHSRKKVIFVITKSEPFGGAQKYVYDLARSLDQESFDVTVICGGNGSLVTKLIEENIEVIGFSWMGRDVSLKSEWRTFIALIKVFRDSKPDIVHLNSSKIGGLGSLAGRIAQVKRIVFTAHGWAFNEKRNWISKNVIKTLYWITLLLSHKTIAVSHATKKQISNWPLIQHKVTVIHNGVEPPDFMGRALARAHLSTFLPKNVSTKHVWIGTVAELHSIKGHIYLIEAAKEIIKQNPRVHFICIGEGEEREILEKQIRKYKLDQNIHLCGYIDAAATYLKGFDMFVLPSLSEALGLAIIEAGMADLPVVASNVGGIPEVITHRKNGFLSEPGANNTLVKYITELLENPEQMSVYGKRIYKETHTNFTLEQTVRKTIKTYNT